MELRQLAYFVAVAEEGHFTRAARRTHIAQPAISRQVIQLERELGERLLVRDSAGVRLTDAGDAFLPHARAVLAAAADGRDAVGALRGLLSGRLSVGTVLPAPGGLPGLLGSFRRQFPGVDLRVREDHTQPLLDAIRRSELDAALVGLGPRQQVPADLESRPIGSEPVVVALSAKHPLATRRSVALSQLRDEPMVTLPRESGQREMLESAATAAGFRPTITAESTDVGLLVALASEGIGVALVPASAATADDRLAVIGLSRPKLRRRMLLVSHRRTLSPAARIFLDQASGCAMLHGR